MRDAGWNHLSPALSPVSGGKGEIGFAVRQIRAHKSFQDEIFGLRGRAVGAHAILDGNRAGFVPAERGVNGPLLRRDVAVDDGKVFLGHGVRFPELAELAGGGGGLGDDDEAGGFAVEAVDEAG